MSEPQLIKAMQTYLHAARIHLSRGEMERFQRMLELARAIEQELSSRREARRYSTMWELRR